MIAFTEGFVAGHLAEAKTDSFDELSPGAVSNSWAPSPAEGLIAEVAAYLVSAQSLLQLLISRSDFASATQFDLEAAAHGLSVALVSLDAADTPETTERN